MRIIHPRLLLAASVALVPLLASSAGAADTTVGTTFTPTTGCASGATVIQTASPDGSSTFTTPGVVTSWSFAVGPTVPANVSLRVGRQVGGVVTIVGASAPTAPAAGETLVRRQTRIPVSAGDLIGSYVDNNGECVRSAAAGFTYAVALGNTTSGPLPGAMAGTSIQVDMSAVVEPDADGDGFGDTTQDRCPTRATTQNECVAPDTAITGVKAKKAQRKADGKLKKAKVTVTFTSSEPSTSTCRVDSGPTVACLSPYVFKAKKGKHVVTVQATDTAGNVDATPAVATVKVKVAKK